MYAGEWDGLRQRLDSALNPSAVQISPFSKARTMYLASQYSILFSERAGNTESMSMPWGVDAAGRALVTYGRIERSARFGRDSAVPGAEKAMPQGALEKPPGTPTISTPSGSSTR